MVGLSPTWVVVGSSEILEVLDDIKSVTEEDIVVDEYLAFGWLVGVKSSEISRDDCNGSLSSSLKEVVINFLNSSVSLCSLCDTVCWEVLDKLVLLIPISDSSRVQAVEWIHHISQGSLVADLVLLPFFERGPMIHLQRWLIQKVWLSPQQLVDILLKLLAKLRRDLVQAPNQRVAESWVSVPLTFSWLWVEIALLDGVVDIESIDAARDSSFANIERLDSKIEQISEEFSVCRDGIEA